MKKTCMNTVPVILGIVLLATVTLGLGHILPEQGIPIQHTWQKAVNNMDHMPGSGGKTFNSYNQPSINGHGHLVFRARSRGGGNHGGADNHDGEQNPGNMQSDNGSEPNNSSSGGHGHGNGPTHGIYFVDMGSEEKRVVKILDRTTQIPGPNNLGTTFIETPSFPRIAMWSKKIATRGNHQPVWEYTLDGVHTRTGTTGIYTNPFGPLVTGVGKLGDVREFAFFAVPESPEIRFEVFPGAPAVTDAGIIFFKGNYNAPDPLDQMRLKGKTGVYYRKIVPADEQESVQLIANSDTLIPNRGKCQPGTTFGSTAPPSAARDRVVFVGLDNEEEPTCGGIYQVWLDQTPQYLTPLVSFETEVPGQDGATLSRIGEGLSYDGRFVSFWGGWGEETKTVRLYCPREGNKIRLDFCNNAGQFAPYHGDPNSICENSGPCYQEKEVPVHQGIFVYDTAGSGRLWLVARTSEDSDLNDFVYWNYSGAPPGSGESEEDGEPPRWRSSAFISVSQRAGATFWTVFLARNGEPDPVTHVYELSTDALHLVEVLGKSESRKTTLIRTGMAGTFLDPQAIDPETGLPLPITSIGLERESLRGRWLAVTSGMGNEVVGWAGIYTTRLPLPQIKNSHSDPEIR